MHVRRGCGAPTEDHLPAHRPWKCSRRQISRKSFSEAGRDNLRARCTIGSWITPAWSPAAETATTRIPPPMEYILVADSRHSVCYTWFCSPLPARTPGNTLAFGSVHCGGLIAKILTMPSWVAAHRAHRSSDDESASEAWLTAQAVPASVGAEAGAPDGMGTGRTNASAKFVEGYIHRLSIGQDVLGLMGEWGFVMPAALEGPMMAEIFLSHSATQLFATSSKGPLAILTSCEVVAPNVVQQLLQSFSWSQGSAKLRPSIWAFLGPMLGKVCPNSARIGGSNLVQFGHLGPTLARFGADFARSWTTSPNSASIGRTLVESGTPDQLLKVNCLGCVASVTRLALQSSSSPGFVAGMRKGGSPCTICAAPEASDNRAHGKQMPMLWVICIMIPHGPDDWAHVANHSLSLAPLWPPLALVVLDAGRRRFPPKAW